ncbi:cytochrome c [Spirosoma sp. BT702]|uniref:Cytochrome c n=1 Tax=Spirosoma profusum TaxID=2771354 RepID=A0A926XX82_9BACT|nr:cytochrome c [Spirosoma profusum]MBD2702294.1 cytochrome c [Spirosoma profusum]
MLIKQHLIQGLVVLTGLFSLNAQYVPNQQSDRLVRPDSLPVRFWFGRPATSEHIARLNDDVRPDGLGLPSGEGVATQGAVLFAAKCAACHGEGGTGGTGGALVVKPAAPGKRTEKVIGNYWPYATTVFDYIQRAMPFNEPGSLTPNEVYALTAYLLTANKLIDEKTVLNANTLRSVKMPAQPLFVPDDRKGGPDIR